MLGQHLLLVVGPCLLALSAWLATTHRWVSQLLGVAAAPVIMLSLAGTFPFTERTAVLIPLVGALAMWAVTGWAPGLLATTGVLLMIFVTGGRVLENGIDSAEVPVLYAAWLVGFGCLSALVLDRLFPPRSFTQGVGLTCWWLGAAFLISNGGVMHGAVLTVAGWSSAVALMAVGVVGFVRGRGYQWLAAALVATLLPAAAMADRFPVVLVAVAVLSIDVAVAALLHRLRGKHDDLP